MYIQSLQIESLRTFETARIDLNVPAEEPPVDPSSMPNVNLLLGDNGSGKTSVLRAAALAALGPILASGSGFVPFSLVRRVRGATASAARIVAKLLLHDQDGQTGEQTIETVLHSTTSGWVDRFQAKELPAWAEGMWNETSPAFLMVGYGASRRVDLSTSFSEEQRSKSRALRYSRVAGLFEEAVTMVPLSSWMPQLSIQDPERHDQVLSLLNDLLEPNAKVIPQLGPSSWEYLFHIGGADLPMQALSDGYRAYVGWVADLLYHLSMGSPSGTSLAKNRGVVLVDEVDLHLHPEWQQRVIPTLARVFPRLQFVLTSHSPLLVGTVHGSNVFVLETEEKEGVRKSILRPSEEEVYGLSADQILTSGHFGLASARNPEFASHLQTQAHAASQGDPEAAIQLMRLMALGAAAEEETTAPQEAPV